MSRSLLCVLLAAGLFLAGCEEDRSQAEAGVAWLGQHRLFRPFGDIGEISRVAIDSAKLIRLEVEISRKAHSRVIDEQSLMIQSLIARYACPPKTSPFWREMGKTVKLRVDLVYEKERIASGICKRS